MEIIIGRESGKELPRLSVLADGNKFFIGEPGSVPKSVSRSHCRLVKDNEGKISITLISEANQLFINGVGYKSRMISEDDFIELGSDRYHLDLKYVLDAAANGPRPAVKGGQDVIVDISGLKKVWNEYETEKLNIQKKNGHINAISAIPGVLSMLSIGLAAFIPESRPIFIGVAALTAIACAVMRWKGADSTPVKMKEIQNRFEDSYTCPNCGHFLNAKSYKLLLKDGSCPYCKARFIGEQP